jgi:hypothetical protein
MFDYSSTLDRSGQITEKYNPNNLYWDLLQHHKDHPEEDICVFLGYHWTKNTGQMDLFTPEIINKIKSISPKIKLVTQSCNYWYLCEDTNAVSWVSWSSWKHSSRDNYTTEYNSSFNFSDWKWWFITPWFHESELLVRNKYFDSFAPITEEREYKEWKTWENRKWIHGLADISEDYIHYNIT